MNENYCGLYMMVSRFWMWKNLGGEESMRFEVTNVLVVTRVNIFALSVLWNTVVEMWGSVKKSGHSDNDKVNESNYGAQYMVVWFWIKGCFEVISTVAATRLSKLWTFALRVLII